jgi:hypothetical protein
MDTTKTPADPIIGYIDHTHSRDIVGGGDNIDVTALETITADIEERGNGYPSRGEYVPGSDGELYRVVCEGRTIETGSPGGNRCTGYTLALASWSDSPDEYPALAMVGPHPMDDEDLDENGRPIPTEGT